MGDEKAEVSEGQWLRWRGGGTEVIEGQWLRWGVDEQRLVMESG